MFLKMAHLFLTQWAMGPMFSKSRQISDCCFTDNDHNTATSSIYANRNFSIHKTYTVQYRNNQMVNQNSKPHWKQSYFSIHFKYTELLKVYMIVDKIGISVVLHRLLLKHRSWFDIYETWPIIAIVSILFRQSLPSAKCDLKRSVCGKFQFQNKFLSNLHHTKLLSWN